VALVTYDLMPVRLDRASSPSALTADAGRLLTNCDVMRLMRRLRRGPGFARMSAAPGTAAFRNLFVGVMGNGTRVAIVNTGTTVAAEIAPVANWGDTETAEEPENGPDGGIVAAPGVNPVSGWNKYTVDYSDNVVLSRVIPSYSYEKTLAAPIPLSGVGALLPDFTQGGTCFQWYIPTEVDPVTVYGIVEGFWDGTWHVLSEWTADFYLAGGPNVSVPVGFPVAVSSTGSLTKVRWTGTWTSPNPAENQATYWIIGQFDLYAVYGAERKAETV
jgi:hypothetical protein